MSLRLEVFTGKEFTFASEWLKRKGLQRLGVTAWSMWRKLQSLILPFKKKIDLQIWHLGRAFEYNFVPGGAGI